MARGSNRHRARSFQSSLSIPYPLGHRISSSNERVFVSVFNTLTSSCSSYRDVVEVTVLEAEVVDLQEMELLADLVEEDAAWSLVLK